MSRTKGQKRRDPNPRTTFMTVGDLINLLSNHNLNSKVFYSINNGEDLNMSRQSVNGEIGRVYFDFYTTKAKDKADR